MEKYVTRMGDGFKVEMTEAEIRRDIEDAIQDAVKRAKISPLTEDEIGYLVELFKSPDNAVGVKRGNEVILSYDSGTTKFKRANVSVSKIQSLQIYERMLGSDTLELAHIDYSFKPVKPIVVFEQPILEQALLMTIPPLFYGAMPNLGLYSQPDGPCPNPADLLPKGKIAEARASYGEAVEHAVKDMVYVGSEMYECGADGINFDTAAAAGDAVGGRLAPAGLGFVTLFHSVGQALGPAIAGWMKDASGTFTSAFILSAVVSLIGAAGSLILKKRF